MGLFRRKECVGRRSDGTPCWNKVSAKVTRCDECWKDLTSKGTFSVFIQILDEKSVPEWVMDIMIDEAERNTNQRYHITMALTSRTDLTDDHLFRLVDIMFLDEFSVNAGWLAELAASTQSARVLERIAFHVDSNEFLDEYERKDISINARNVDAEIGDESMWLLVNEKTRAIFNVWMRYGD